MTPPRTLALCLLLAAALGGCATRTAPVAVAAPPPPVPAFFAVPMPAGAHPGMAIPPQIDGGYATPNRNLSPAATVWHLRSALNFAALACRGPQEAETVARYNAMLRTQRAVLAGAERALIAEYRATGGAGWRDAYDDAMTRLYNYYALAPARRGLCAAAAQVLAEAQTVAPAQFDAFATARLPDLDRTFTDFFAAYDAWRTQNVPVRPMLALAATSAPRDTPSWPPRIEVDPAILVLP